MSERELANGGVRALLRLYDSALPQVYGYLLGRCGQPELAEDLTTESFLAAADALRQQPASELSTGWLIGVARHKLADHWRRTEREAGRLEAIAREQPSQEDSWDARLDAMAAEAVLARLTPVHRLALTLRYVDDLPVTRVAELLQRSVHATEGVLVRARAAFRRIYEQEGGHA